MVDLIGYMYLFIFLW